ncbi:MAG: T9SS type A sorting domain-containing protein [Parafilimonas sp.]|nr:T9SS type A sorting domain-containing protein [Parafilimonas sp.]
MKHSLLFLFLLLFISSAYSQGTWKRVSNMPGCTARDNAVAFTIGGKGYYGTGQDSVNNTYRDDMWEYDTVTNYWTQIASVPLKKTTKVTTGGRTGAVGFAIKGKGYVGLGYAADGTPLSDFWAYDTTANKWSQKTVFPGSAGGFGAGVACNNLGFVYIGQSLWQYTPSSNSWTQKRNFPGLARTYPAFFVINNTNSFYITTGVSSGTPLNDCWKYDQPTDTWTQQPNFPGAVRWGATGFSAANKGYVGFGFNLNGGFNVFGDMYEFNPTNSTWTKKSNLNALFDTARLTAASFSFANAGYVLGGVGYGSFFSGLTADCYVYYPAADKWQQKCFTDVSIRNGATAFSIGNNGYISGGFDGQGTRVYSDVFQYNQSTDTWTKVADYPGGSTQHLITQNPGTLFAWAFSVESKAYMGYYKSFWAYDSVTKSWSQKANSPDSLNPGAAFSINNNGYVLRGDTTLFYQYNTQTNKWTKKANFPGGKRNGATAFTINKKGYIGMGGTIRYNPAYKDFYEYDPSTNAWTRKANFPGGIRTDAVGFSIGKFGYAGTGNGDANASPNGNGSIDFYRYSPANDKWVRMADFIGGARHLAAAFTINGKGYVGTGDDDYTHVNNPSGTHGDFYEYTPSGSGFDEPSVMEKNIASPELNSSISVSPNPANAVISVSFNTKNTRSFLLIINQSGNIVSQKQISTIAGKNTVQLNIASLTPGVYTISLITTSGLQTQRFIKE